MIHHFWVLHLEFIGMMNVYVVEYVNKSSMNVQRALWIDMVFRIVNMIIQGKIPVSILELNNLFSSSDDCITNVLLVKRIYYEMI